MHETTSTTPAETATADPKRRYLCRHIFTDGYRCGSPALRGQDLCYYHGRSRREAPISGRSGTFPMPRIDDRAAVQLALYEVLSRLSSGDIEYKRGAILLRGLAIASSNLPRHTQTNAEQQPQVEEVTSDYHLGDLAPIAEIPEPEPAPVALSEEAQPAPPPPERDYTEEEKSYLKYGTTVTGFEPGSQPRPASVTDQDIDAHVNACRKRYGLPPLKSKKQKPTTQPVTLPTPQPPATHPTAIH
jgi:hypothetical protein